MTRDYKDLDARLDKVLTCCNGKTEDEACIILAQGIIHLWSELVKHNKWDVEESFIGNGGLDDLFNIIKNQIRNEVAGNKKANLPFEVNQ